MSKEKIQSEESQIAEYSAANDTYMHYDNFSWQVGSILFAGVFAFWGFVASGKADSSIVSLLIGQVLVIAMMSVWILYSSHNRQIYLCKIHRMVELEASLGMKTHSYWERSLNYYKTFSISGHFLNYCIYWLSGLGTCAVVGSKTVNWSDIFIKKPYFWFTLLSLATLFLTQIYINKNENKLKQHLRSL